MQRGCDKTVTDIPVLVPCGVAEKEGIATWLGDVRETYQYVRAVTQNDLAQNSKKNPIRSVSEIDKGFFLSIVALLKGLQEKDQLAIRKAREKIVLALGSRKGFEPDSEDVVRVASELGLQPAEKAIAMELFTIGPGQAVDMGWLFSSILSDELDSVRLVLWWTGKQFRPALYCPDLKSALYTPILMRMVAGRGWGVCPQCGNFFVQKRQDQSYCSVAHREAHRVARWRAELAKKPKKGRGKYGTRKTR